MEFGFFDALNSREDAVAVWTVVFLVFVAIKIEGIGSSFLDVLRALAQPRLLALFGLAALYCAGLVYGARELDLWHTSALKETLYWFFLTGVVFSSGTRRTPRPRSTSRRFSAKPSGSR